MIRRFAAGVFALCFAFAPATPQESSSLAALDHVILVGADLDSTAASLARLGFRFKAGRLHSNNLINRHIKFRDGTGIELMALAGPPKDSMAIRYAALLGRGAGGAYVALRTGDLDAVEAVAERLGLAPRRSASGPWRFLGFPGSSDASAVFFTSGGAPANDPDSVTRHRNGALALTEVWVEGGPLLDSLLMEVGARHAGEVERGEGRQRVPRPRPLGAILGRTRLAAVPISVNQLPNGFWIVLTNSGPDD